LIRHEHYILELRRLSFGSDAVFLSVFGIAE
jgi:hypothetical protein